MSSLAVSLLTFFILCTASVNFAQADSIVTKLSPAIQAGYDERSSELQLVGKEIGLRIDPYLTPKLF